MMARWVACPAPRDVWRDLVAANPAVLPSQTPAWLDAVCASGRFTDVSRLYETSAGRQVVLPMVRAAGMSRIVPVEHSLAPTWGSGGLVAAGEVRVADVREVFADLAPRPVLRTTVRPDFRQAPAWAAAAPPAAAVELPTTHHVLDLDEDFGRIHQQFNKMARKAIRKAEREGVTVESAAGGRDVPVFWDLYQRWVAHRARERGLPLPLARCVGVARRERVGVSLATAPPLSRLRSLSEHLADVFRVWVARVDGAPIAAMITLVRGEVAVAWRATSDVATAGPLRAMDLVHRHAIEFACAQGCRYYNFGESGGVESLMRYKARFGATPRTFSGYRLERLPITPVTRRVGALRPGVERVALGAARAVRGRVSRQPAASAPRTRRTGR